MPDVLIHCDQQLLLWFNRFHSLWMDAVMMALTSTETWLPFLACTLIAVNVTCSERTHWRRHALPVFIALGLVVLCSDQFSSSLCKPLFCRLRPTHEPSLSGLVQVVWGYRGGMYGFISSHAANTFGASLFLSMVFRHRVVTCTLFAWAAVCSYTRMYLGVHYPGDILCGALAGMSIAWIIYRLYQRVTCRIGMTYTCDGRHWIYSIPIAFVSTLIYEVMTNYCKFA